MLQRPLAASAPASNDPVQPRDEEATDADQDYNAELMEVISKSRSEVGALPLSSEGVVLSRLTRMTGSKRLQDHLDTCEHLAAVQERLQASGCLMRPDFTAARTCIPLTEDMLQETGFELGQEHIISMASDVPLLAAALKDFNCKGKRRPQLAAPHEIEATAGSVEASVEDGPPMQQGLMQEEAVESDDEGDVELERVDGFSLRTDSSVGWPASPFYG